MEGSREIVLDDAAWWATHGESYWQALLEQGRIAWQDAPPFDLSEPQQRDLDHTSPEITPSAAPPGGDGPEAETDWQIAQRALEEGRVFHLQVAGANRGGLLVHWNGLQGFVPASHLLRPPRALSRHARLAELADRVGDLMRLRLIEVDAERNRLVFSERAAVAAGPPAPANPLETLQPGDVCRGTVTNLTAFGAFVDLGGIEGLIHVSEMSWDRVRHPGDVVQPGQQVQVYVLGVNREQGRIALSLRKLRPNPWESITERYRVGDVIEGQVTNVVNFGAFVRVEEGLEGLIHSSELADGRFFHPRNVIREGDWVRVRILKIDPVHRRLALSLRRAFDGYFDRL